MPPKNARQSKTNLKRKPQSKDNVKRKLPKISNILEINSSDEDQDVYEPSPPRTTRGRVKVEEKKKDGARTAVRFKAASEESEEADSDKSEDNVEIPTSSFQVDFIPELIPSPKIPKKKNKKSWGEVYVQQFEQVYRESEREMQVKSKTDDVDQSIIKIFDNLEEETERIKLTFEEGYHNTQKQADQINSFKNHLRVYLDEVKPPLLELLQKSMSFLQILPTSNEEIMVKANEIHLAQMEEFSDRSKTSAEAKKLIKETKKLMKSFGQFPMTC
ncbi:hypothetical protein M231_02291 [Tremella mesenterica]|uniref:Uncharacterized protein n=1 Tax=Tremella mesenterica TaxID=5217 RepID=A0A4Q1BR81_TREME|nr:uncharacterized protein TREMEDRAFT_65398 [Tremella mesenterica DSM 1558]EIW66529.1 hypothetical protein TREMEDRAFT_65398 [Tremella mesenterica DSM 1558]RXK40458.1 hypothetical protein M231_02291 [Tremella mesenterica]